MTDKLYNGFREGRAPGDHKPNNQVRGMTQETMTKEQILEKHAKVRIFDNLYTGNEIVSCQCVLPAMEEYAQQKVAAELERAGKLVEAVQSFVQASDDFNIGYINRNGEITRCGIAALSVAFNAAEKRLRIALTESNKP